MSIIARTTKFLLKSHLLRDAFALYNMIPAHWLNYSIVNKGAPELIGVSETPNGVSILYVAVRGIHSTPGNSAARLHVYRY